MSRLRLRQLDRWSRFV